MANQTGLGDGAAEAAPLELAQELQRIDGEKTRLRLLADQLGLTRPEVSSPTPPASELSGAPAIRSEAALPPPATRRPARRLSVPFPAAPAASAPTPASQADLPPSAPPPSGVRAGSSRSVLEALAGFVPAALYEEMKRERDELFFRLTKLEMERSQAGRVRRSLAGMEEDVRRLEEEIRKRRASESGGEPGPEPGGDAGAAGGIEPLRLSYRRWLALRRQRSLRFTDYLACHRAERGET